MKKIFLSVSIIAAAAAIIIGGTSAYFSDEEISSGNTFTAGAIDLKVSNQYKVSDEVIVNDKATFIGKSDDIGEGEVFFSFSDLKPGDWGENTIDLKVVNNDSWMCAKIEGKDEENTLVDPEFALNDDEKRGELGKYLNLIWWTDDGDNILESNENVLYGGPITFENLIGGASGSLDLTIADTLPHNVYEGSGPLIGDKTYYLGVGWCFGKLSIDYSAPTGFSCDGTGEQNIAQTDMITASLGFSAIQSRNNLEYLCPEHEQKRVQ